MPERGPHSATGKEREPLTLDPELHQSVWKPWMAPAKSDPAPFDIEGEAAGVTQGRRGWRRTVLAATAVCVLALMSPMALLQPMHAPMLRLTPLVEDISTAPGISWSIDSGVQVCNAALDEDQGILTKQTQMEGQEWTSPSDGSRVWSVDLRTGSTRWSVDLPGHWEFTCLPGADLVVATELTGDEPQDVVRTTLLRGSTGSEMGQLPDASTTQVIPLGPNIGLVDSANTLRVVKPEQLDAPLWSHQLPGSPGGAGQISVSDIDDSTVQLSYSTSTGSGSKEHFMPIYSLRDGRTPPWSRGTASDQYRYTRLGSVFLWEHMENNTPKASILNMKGRILWELDDLTPIIAESRLYVASSLATGPGFGHQVLREVDPLSGAPANDDVFGGQFSFVISAPQGHLAIFTTDAAEASVLEILDEHLQPQGAIPVLGYNSTYEGAKWLYVRSTIHEGVGASRTRLSAIDPNGSRVLWNFDLGATQHIEQLGRHLVIVDSLENTIQGLRSE